MMRSKYVGLWVAIIFNGATYWASGQQTTTREEVGPDGTRYRVTQQTWQQSVPYTDYETREQKSYRPQVTSQYQSYQQTYAVPVTEYRWVSRYRNWWNPFSPPYWTHSLEPHIRWDYRTGNVQIPVPQTKWVEETRTVQVPVTKYRTVENTSTSRVAISARLGATSPPDTLSPAASTPMVATRTVESDRYGSQRLTTDIPAEPSPLSGLGSGTLRR